MNPLVSVIIPVYNVSPYLRESLDSVISQTYTNLEIIAVDDGSTDDSGRICDEYAEKDTRIKVIHQANRGLSAARNAGLNAMTGEYVAFLDSDDALYPEMVECMVKGMEKNAADIAVCEITMHQTMGRLSPQDDRGEHTGKYPHTRVLSSEKVLNMLLENAIRTVVWDKVYKSHIWENIRFSENRVYEDLPVMPRLLEKAGLVLLTDRELVKYRVRPYSITRTKSPHNIKHLILAMAEREKYVAEHIPNLFSRDALIRLQDRDLRKLVIRCAELMYGRKTTEAQRFTVFLRRYLIKKGKKINGGCSLLTKITFAIFQYVPYAVPLLRTGWQAIRLQVNKKYRVSL